MAEVEMHMLACLLLEHLIDHNADNSFRFLQDGMVEILQKCLQQYSGVSILRARELQKNEKDDNAKLFDKLLSMDTDRWDAEIRNGIKETDGLTTQSLIAEIQKTMETVVLGLENGSMAQRVQAEFLRELVSRVEAVEASA